MLTKTQKKNIAKRNILFQQIINFLAGFVFLGPVITLLYKNVGLNVVDIILLSNINSLLVWVLEIPTSVLADTFGYKKSLVASVFCNFLTVIILFIYPSYFGFILAAIASGFYYSLWSGTGQAFLDENLKVLGDQKSFGKKIASFMFYEQFAGLITPLIASLILGILHFAGYRVLAGIDVVFGLIMLIITIKLIDLKPFKHKVKNVKSLFVENYKVAVHSLKTVFSNAKLKLILLYRSLSNHVAFFLIIFLPQLVDLKVPDWYCGIILSISTIGMMIVLKITGKLSHKISFNKIWVLGTVLQAILLIVAGIFLNNWIILALVYIFFVACDGFWQPAWNHVVVEESRGKNVATVRSIIFSMFALYTTIGKQVMALFPIHYALIGLGVFILVVNLVLSKKIIEMGEK